MNINNNTISKTMKPKRIHIVDADWLENPGKVLDFRLKVKLSVVIQDLFPAIKEPSDEDIIKEAESLYREDIDGLTAADLYEYDREIFIKGAQWMRNKLFCK